MKSIFIFILILFISGCSSPPPPVEYPSDAKPEKFDLLKSPTSNKVIKNSSKIGWDITTYVNFDDNNNLHSFIYNELELSYLLGNSDEIIISGSPLLMEKINNYLNLNNYDSKISYNNKCYLENCILSLQFKKMKITK